MRIRSVTAHSFGPLSGQTLHLAPGLTVVTGVNESAKSSWHAAIYAALCGRKRGKGAPSREDRRFLELHRPWDGGGWEVSCVVELADGRAVELRHDLDGRVDCRATDLTTGADVSGEIIHDGAPDGARWLGLDRRSFAATASVSQAELLSVLGAADGLQGHLQRAAATAGTTDATAALALERIDRFQREQVGAQRAGSGRPLRAALDAVAVAADHLATASVEHDAYLQAAAAARTSRASAEEAESAVIDLGHQEAVLTAAADVALEVEQAAAEVEHAEDRLVESAERLTQRRRRWEAAAHLQAALPQTAPTGAGRRHQLAQQVTAAVAAWDAVPPAMTLEGPSSTQLRTEIDALPAHPDGETAVDPAVAELAVDLDRAMAVARHHRSARPSGTEDAGVHAVADGGSVHAAAIRVGPAALRDLAAQVDALTGLLGGDPGSTGGAPARPATQRITVRPALLGCLALLLAGLVTWSSGWVVPGLVLVLAAVGGAGWAALRGRAGKALAVVGAPVPLGPLDHDAAQARLRAVAARCRSLGVPPGAHELRRWAQRAERAADQQQEWLRWELDDQEHQAVVRDLEERLRTVLRPRLAVDGTGDVQQLYRDYERACIVRRGDVALAARRDGLMRAWRDRQSAEAAAAARQELLAFASAAVLDAADLAGLRVPALVTGEATGTEQAVLTDLVDDLRRWHADLLSGLDMAETDQQQRSRLAALLDGATLDGLLEQVEEARGSHARFVAQAQRCSERLADAEARLRTALIAADLPELLEAAEVDSAALRRQAAGSRDAVAAARSAATERVAVAAALEGAAQQRARVLPDVAEAEEALVLAESELARIRQLQETLELTRRFLRGAQERVHRDIAPVLADSLNRDLATVTVGRYVEALVDPATLLVEVCGADRRWRSADRLSVGTAEQVYLLLRIALAAHLPRAGESCPLLLDDVTVQADEQRTLAILDLLLAAAQERQVVLFAQEPAVAGWAADRLLGDERHAIVALPAPA